MFRENEFKNRNIMKKLMSLKGLKIMNRKDLKKINGASLSIGTGVCGGTGGFLLGCDTYIYNICLGIGGNNWNGCCYACY